jgi:hypothetical protein
MVDKYADVKSVFFAEALRSTLPQGKLPYRHKLKNITGNFIASYNQDVTKTMVAMYENHDEAFDQISDYLAKIGEEFGKVKLTRYAEFLYFVQKFNEETESE